MESTNRKACIWNYVTAGTVLFAVAWMFSGILIGHGRVALTAARWSMLKYYTVDSNILMGVAALLMGRSQRAVLKGEKKEIAPALCVLKLAGVVGVTLTMLVVVFFLAPTMPGGWRAMFSNSNLFLHLLIPLMSLFCFLRLERGSLTKRREALWGVSSVALYALGYALNCAVHTVDDVVPRQYDWYGFALGGLRRGCLVSLPLLLLVAYGVSLSLWRLNRRSEIFTRK